MNPRLVEAAQAVLLHPPVELSAAVAPLLQDLAQPQLLEAVQPAADSRGPVEVGAERARDGAGQGGEGLGADRGRVSEVEDFDVGDTGDKALGAEAAGDQQVVTVLCNARN